MSLTSRWLSACALAAVTLLSTAATAWAQAFTPPQGVGAVTFSWQFVDNTGHRGTDGFLVKRGQSQTTSVLAEVEFGVTDRLAASVGLPYVFAKYTGALPPPSRLPVDSCACWNSAFQDVALGVRYRLGTDVWALTPTFRYGQPSHNYPFQGEAVVGRNLPEARVGVIGALKLVNLLPKASVQAGYLYSFVQRALDDINIDRSNAFVEVGYGVTRSLFLGGTSGWQRTHGGLRAGSASGQPFPLPGELNTPERFAQRDRLIRSNYWHLGAQAAYSFGAVDVFVNYTKYVNGTDTHDGQAYTTGVSWYFDLTR